MTYQPPPTGYGQAPPYVPPPYSVGDAVTWAWYMFRKHWKVFVTGMIPIVLVALVYFGFFLALYIPFIVDTGGDWFTDEGLELVKKLAILHGAYFVVTIPLLVLSANLLRAALVAADGGTPTYRTLVSLEHAGRIMVTGALLLIGMMIGMVLCYVPGLALALFSMFTIPFIVDKHLSGIAAFKASIALVKPNLGLVMLTMLAVGGITYAGSMALYIGLAVSLPVALLITAYAYRSMVPATSQA